MPIQKRQQELLEQYKFECCCPECEKGKSGNEKRRSVECAKNGCSGYIPLPGRAEMIGNKELQCIQCKTSRRVRLGESEEKEGQSVKDNYKSHGIAWLMDQADDLLPRLSKQSPDHSSDFANMSLAGELEVDRIELYWGNAVADLSLLHFCDDC